MKVYVLCPVRLASEEDRKKLEKYAEHLEEMGHAVHLPHRDTDQTLNAFSICCINTQKIKEADEVHVFYNPKSQGIHFDLGAAFALKKTIRIIENESIIEKKSFAEMLKIWNTIE